MARRQNDDDDAPWLAEVDGDVRTSTAVPRGRVIGGLILFLLLLTLVVVGVFVVISKKQDGATGVGVTRAEDAPLITADPGPYKVAPDADAGGNAPDTPIDDSQQGAGAGNDVPGNLDPSRAPEEPEPRPGSAPKSILPETEDLPAIPPANPAAAVPVAPAPAPVRVAPAPVATPPAAAAVVPPKPKPVTPAPAPPAPAAATGGTTLQLGAFSSAGKAEQAWASLSARYTWLAALKKRIEPVERDTGTLYRLRATGSVDAAAAAAACAKLKVAGEACVVTP